MKILFVGQTDPDSLNHYYQIDESACCVDLDNVDDFLQGKLDKQYGVFYTSVTDLNNNLEIFSKVCFNCDEIVYLPPKIWANDLAAKNTRRYLNIVSQKKQIKNYSILTDPIEFQLNDTRKTDDPQLWIAGCSCSSAEGVEDYERWGHLLAKKLNLPVSFLAQAGSGNRFQIDQILCSDVRESDIIVLQLTGLPRYDYFVGHIEHLNHSHYPLMEMVCPLDRLTEHDVLEKTIRSFAKLKNFCYKINAKLVLFDEWALSDSQEIYDKLMLEYFLTNFEHFYQLEYNGKFIDLGTDNKHPGPKSHQRYTDFLYEKLK